MSERTKLIVLMVLLGVLLIAAAFAVFGPSGLARKSAKKQSAETVADKQVLNPLPTASAFGELAEWLAPEGSGIMLASVQAGPIFGLPVEAVVKRPDVTRENPVATRQVQVAQPPRLQGIFWSADRPSALIDGERYYVGQQLKNANFKVLSIGTSLVRLRSDRGEEVILDLLR